MAFNYNKYRAAQFETPSEKSPLEAKAVWEGVKTGGKILGKGASKILGGPVGWGLLGLDAIDFATKAGKAVMPGLKKRAKEELEGRSMYTSPKW